MPFVSVGGEYYDTTVVNGVITFPICTGVSSPEVKIENASFYNATNPQGTTYSIQIGSSPTQSIDDEITETRASKLEDLDINDLPKRILKLKGKNFIIDDKSCSIFFENLINSKFKIINREDPIYLLKAIKNKTEIKNMINAHIFDGVALTKFLYWMKKINKKKN